MIGHLIAGDLHRAETNPPLDALIFKAPQLSLSIERADVGIHRLSLVANILKLLELSTKDNRATMQCGGGS